MAKRIRGQRSTHRPGGQGPSRADRDERATPTGGPAPAIHEAQGLTTAPAATLRPTPAPARAAASVGEARARSTPRREAPAGPREAPTGPAVTRARSRMRADSLSSRAAAELVYVTDDLRRIGVVSVVMLGVLVVLWLLMAVIDPLSVY